MIMELFPLPEPIKAVKPTIRCRSCNFILKFRSDVSIFYCEKKQSRRTDNGLLKIKANDAACFMFEKRI